MASFRRMSSENIKQLGQANADRYELEGLLKGIRRRRAYGEFLERRTYESWPKGTVVAKPVDYDENKSVEGNVMCTEDEFNRILTLIESLKPYYPYLAGTNFNSFVKRTHVKFPSSRLELSAKASALLNQLYHPPRSSGVNRSNNVTKISNTLKKEILEETPLPTKYRVVVGDGPTPAYVPPNVRTVGGRRTVRRRSTRNKKVTRTRYRLSRRR